MRIIEKIVSYRSVYSPALGKVSVFYKVFDEL